MYKRVDESSEDVIEGFSYVNKLGEAEFVDFSLAEGVVDISVESHSISIYTSDIPKLILALQAAYDYLEKK